MDIDSPRALFLRLVVGEAIARRGEGPLAPRYFRRLPLVPPRPRRVPAAEAEGRGEEPPP